MNTSTRQLISQYYAAFNAQNMQQFSELLADGVVHEINQGLRKVEE